MKAIKKISLLLFLSVFLTTTVYSQSDTNSKVVYKKKIDAKKTENDTPVSVIDYINKMNEELENIEYILLFNNKESLFKYDENLESDFNNLTEMSISLGGGDAIVYTNNETNKKIEQKEKSADLFLVESDFDNDWELTTETKSIKNYTCYKATTSFTMETIRGPKVKEVVAWYTKEIPYSFGPNGFGNLSGLILELKVGKVTFYTDSIELDFDDSVEIKAPTKGIKKTGEEMIELEKVNFEKFKKMKK